MSNTIRLTSVRGEVQWGKSLSYDGDRLAQRTGTAWIAQDLDWPERNDYPRWFLPRGGKTPTDSWLGSIVKEVNGDVRFSGPLSDEQLQALIEAGATVFTKTTPGVYDNGGATFHEQHADWTDVGSSETTTTARSKYE